MANRTTVEWNSFMICIGCMTGLKNPSRFLLQLIYLTRSSPNCCETPLFNTNPRHSPHSACAQSSASMQHQRVQECQEMEQIIIHLFFMSSSFVRGTYPLFLSACLLIGTTLNSLCGIKIKPSREWQSNPTFILHSPSHVHRLPFSLTLQTSDRGSQVERDCSLARIPH